MWLLWFIGGVQKPVVCERSVTTLLVMVCVWDMAHCEALFDVCVMDTDVQSYTSCLIDNVLITAGEEKKQKCGSAAGAHHVFSHPSLFL